VKENKNYLPAEPKVQVVD